MTRTPPTTGFYQKVAMSYPSPAAEYYARDASRMSFQASLLFKPGQTFVDVGSGLTPLALGLQLLGMATTMVDRFDYPVEMKHIGPPGGVITVLEKEGVALKPIDIASEPMPLADNSVDSLSCIACIEHLHASPCNLFAEIYRVLRPGGRYLMGCPNSVNLRKRLSVVRGRSNLPPIKDFWVDGHPVWYGHVREPTLPEMSWMARAAGLRVVATFGRNFIGEENYGLPARVLDPLLRRAPNLCSDIYVLAEKPGIQGP